MTAIGGKRNSANCSRTIDEMFTITCEGFSSDSYSESGWRSTIVLLRKHGLTDNEIYAWMLSKHTRWAGDYDAKRKYGHYNSQTVKEYIAGNGERCISQEELDMLTSGTGPIPGQKEMAVNLTLRTTITLHSDPESKRGATSMGHVLRNLAEQIENDGIWQQHIKDYETGIEGYVKTEHCDLEFRG